MGIRVIAAGQLAGFRGVAVTATNSDDVAAMGIAAVAQAWPPSGSPLDRHVRRPHQRRDRRVDRDQLRADLRLERRRGELGAVVHVAAANQFYELGIAGTVAVAMSAGIAVPVGVRVVNLDTDAYIGASAQVNAADDVVVSATGTDNIVSVVVGAGGGLVGVAGSVSVAVVGVHT